MEGIAEATFQYLTENLVVMLAIALIVGFAAVKSVAMEKKGNILLYLFVGLIGTFLGQFAIMYLDIKKILDQLPEFRYFFDLLAAYVASFVIASLIHFVRPM